MKNILVVICGPTAVGKTDAAIRLALRFGCEIISADARQFYRELNIGVATPSEDQLSRVTHHFIGSLSIHDYYNVSLFEQQALDTLNTCFKTMPLMIMVGGSGLYLDAVCKGIDLLPDPSPELRSELQQKYTEQGLEYLQTNLKRLDPDYYAEVDIRNPNRLLRALEVCLVTGKPFSSLRQHQIRVRPFSILKIGLNLPREELFSRIVQRVDTMIHNGLVEEVAELLPYRYVNALNTVGYKELFDYFDGKSTLDEAIKQIKTNTRRYAKRQLTWFKKDPSIVWFHPDEYASVEQCIHRKCTVG